MPPIAKRLQEIQAKARADGHWALVCAMESALKDGADLDNQINVIGAMHEVGSLRNRIAPLWKEWRKDEAAWAKRCIERLGNGDHDYWAVAALLGLPIKNLDAVVRKAGYVLVSTRYAAMFDKPDTHIAVYSRKPDTDMSIDDSICLAPIIEIGWDSKSGEVIDSARWRAVILDNAKKKDGNWLGSGSGSYYLRAGLPYGCWRMQSADFTLVSEAAISRKKTLIG